MNEPKTSAGTSSTEAAAEAAAPVPAPVSTDAGLLLMVVIWAVNFSVIKVALAALQPLTVNALRFPLAALTVYLILRRRALIFPSREHVARVLVLGLLGNIVYQFLFIYGVARTRAGNAALLLAGTPMLTALLSAAVGHERVGARVWLGVLATLAGMGFVVAGGAAHPELGGGFLGNLLLLGASLAWAAYTVGARNLVDTYGPVPVTAWTLWIGAVGLLLAGLPTLPRVDWSGTPLLVWAAVAYAGALSIGLAYLLWYRGVHYIGSTRTAMYSNLVPVVALAVAWLWLGEVPTLWQITGAAVIIGGVTLARRTEA
ncbi:MAG: EamA family transporter [Gemmatimonadetes bacterium]|nr:EamA family transporter [Gemmatimonadota bacterium]